MLPVRPESEAVKAAAENDPDSVVVAVSPPLRAALVPYAKPRTVGLTPPVAVIVPLAVMDEPATEEAAWVVTVGAEVGEYWLITMVGWLLLLPSLYETTRCVLSSAAAPKKELVTEARDTGVSQVGVTPETEQIAAVGWLLLEPLSYAIAA